MVFWPVYVLLAVTVLSPRDARSACEENGECSIVCVDIRPRIYCSIGNNKNQLDANEEVVSPKEYP